VSCIAYALQMTDLFVCVACAAAIPCVTLRLLLLLLLLSFSKSAETAQISRHSLSVDLRVARHTPTRPGPVATATARREQLAMQLSMFSFAQFQRLK
jgi:hypothetical protein